MFGCVVTEYYYNSFYAPSVRSSIVYLSQAFDLSNSMSLYISSTCTLVMLKSFYFMTEFALSFFPILDTQVALTHGDRDFFFLKKNPKWPSQKN